MPHRRRNTGFSEQQIGVFLSLVTWEGKNCVELSRDYSIRVWNVCQRSASIMGHSLPETSELLFCVTVVNTWSWKSKRHHSQSMQLWRSKRALVWVFQRGWGTGGWDVVPINSPWIPSGRSLHPDTGSQDCCLSQPWLDRGPPRLILHADWLHEGGRWIQTETSWTMGK